jgi:hypothetical protein
MTVANTSSVNFYIGDAMYDSCTQSNDAHLVKV